VNVPDAVRRCQLCLDRRQERLYADDIHDAREILGEYVQRHLGRNFRQALHQKMRRAHPHLERAEGMLRWICSSLGRQPIRHFTSGWSGAAHRIVQLARCPVLIMK
jgi:hypothetical protein